MTSAGEKKECDICKDFFEDRMFLFYWYIYIYTHICMCICICMYIHIHIHIYIYVYWYIYICIYVCMYICIYWYILVYMSILLGVTIDQVFFAYGSSEVCQTACPTMPCRYCWSIAASIYIIVGKKHSLPSLVPCIIIYIYI